MFVKGFIALAGLSLMVTQAAPVMAQDAASRVWVSYRITDDSPKVTGYMQVGIKDGKTVIPKAYSVKRIGQLIAGDCASGKVGKITLGKQQTKRKWAFVRQAFETTCAGGPHPSIGATSGTVMVTVERPDGGRDKAEYFFGRNGNMVTTYKNR